MGDLVKRVITNIKERRENIINGNINSIPSPFIRFRNDFIGIEQAQYITITAPTKGSKSQFGSFMYIFTPIDYAYNHKDIVSVKILYFALEETPERVVQRYMSYLLYTMSNGRYRISPRDLRSTDNEKPLDEEIIEILESEEYQERLKFFEDCVIFCNDGNNPTGIYKSCRDYALTCGHIVNKRVKYGEDEHEVFDYYVPDDPRQYKIVFIDHIGLIDLERGFSLKQSIDKLSEYLAKYLRNRYGFTSVVIQQQSFEQEGLEAQKFDKVETSVAALGDSKYTARDSNIVLGLFSPFKYGKAEHKRYDITKFRDNIRFLTVLVNRDGEMGGVCPLYFDGAVCYFRELPKPDDKIALEKVYAKLDNIRNVHTAKLFFIKSIKKICRDNMKKLSLHH